MSEDVKTQSPKWEKGLVEMLHDYVYLIAGVLIVFLVFFRIVLVSGPSMRTTLLDGDYLLLAGNLICGQLEQGDIVVVTKEQFDDGKPIIKRVIAGEDQIVDIDFGTGTVYVDGLPLEEPYISTPTTVPEGMEFPLVVEKGCYFVMGDNRQHSLDSRSPEIGQVDRREILGKALFLIVPGTDFGKVQRDFSRIGLLQ